MVGMDVLRHPAMHSVRSPTWAAIPCRRAATPSGRRLLARLGHEHLLRIWRTHGPTLPYPLWLAILCICC